MTPEDYISPVRRWLETIVIELNLCPFAKREFVRNRIRFVVSEAHDEEQLLADLDAELALLDADDSIENTLLIHPHVLQDFDHYTLFLSQTGRHLKRMGYRGIYQIASFHPDYQFAGSEPEDVENTTNRSPYPLLHLIREAGLARAVENYPDPEDIPERNIALVESMGAEKMRALLQACFEGTAAKPK